MRKEGETGLTETHNPALLNKKRGPAPTPEKVGEVREDILEGARTHVVPFVRRLQAMQSRPDRPEDIVRS